MAVPTDPPDLPTTCPCAYGYASGERFRPWSAEGVAEVGRAIASKIAKKWADRESLQPNGLPELLTLPSIRDGRPLPDAAPGLATSLLPDQFYALGRELRSHAWSGMAGTPQRPSGGGHWSPSLTD